MPTVVSNFLEDVRQDSEVTLARDGVALPPGADAHLALIEVFHFKRRILRPMPRNVVWSRELQARALSDDHRLAVERIARELEKGVCTKPRMTKSVRVPGYNDGLLSDWGIHHLHIGEKLGRDGFIERGGPLLFVFVVQATAYLIDLLDHGSFEDEELIEILHGNWPRVMASWLAPGVVPGSLSPKFTSAQRKMMRGKFTIATETRDGTIYVAPGGGIMTSGHSSEAVRQAHRVLNLVHPAKVWVADHAEWIAAQVERATGQPPQELHMRFDTWRSMQMGGAVLWETTSKLVLVGVPPPPGTEPTLRMAVEAPAGTAV